MITSSKLLNVMVSFEILEPDINIKVNEYIEDTSDSNNSNEGDRLMRVTQPRILKVCLITPYPPQEKGAAEYAHMFIDALHRSLFQLRLQVRIISEVDKKCPKGKTLLYPPERNFVLERDYGEDWPYSNLSFLRIFKAILRDKPHVAHFYWPGTCGGFLGDFTGETLLILFVLFRLLSVKILLTMHTMWLPSFAEQEAFKRVNSRIVAKAVKAYFFVFMFTLCHLANKVLIGVLRGHSVMTKRFAASYKIPSYRIGEEHAGCLELKRRGFNSIQQIKRRLRLAGKRVVLCFGFIRPDKGLEYAIKAIREIVESDKSVTLIIAGRPLSGKDRLHLNELRGLAKKLDLDDYVVFDNRFIPLEEVIDYFSIADVLVLPYTEHVGFSGPLNLAISLGVPTIATSVGEQMPGLADLIRLIPPKDVGALGEALKEMLLDADLREKIRAKLISHATKYSCSKTARMIIDTYLNMLGK